MIFRGSIPHPMQSLCTLRDPCRQWPRNTRYQADATPYLGRTSTGWIAPALRLAHLLDHLVGAGEHRLDRNPAPTGLTTPTNTIGTLRVTCSNAARVTLVGAIRTSGAIATNSAACRA